MYISWPNHSRLGKDMATTSLQNTSTWHLILESHGPYASQQESKGYVLLEQKPNSSLIVRHATTQLVIVSLQTETKIDTPDELPQIHLILPNSNTQQQACDFKSSFTSYLYGNFVAQNDDIRKHAQSTSIAPKRHTETAPASAMEIDKLVLPLAQTVSFVPSNF